MNAPMHTDLLKHLPASHAAPSPYARTALRALRRAAFLRFVDEVFASLPRPPVTPAPGASRPVR